MITTITLQLRSSFCCVRVIHLRTSASGHRAWRWRALCTVRCARLGRTSAAIMEWFSETNQCYRVRCGCVRLCACAQAHRAVRRRAHASPTDWSFKHGERTLRAADILVHTLAHGRQPVMLSRAGSEAAAAADAARCPLPMQQVLCPHPGDRLRVMELFHDEVCHAGYKDTLDRMKQWVYCTCATCVRTRLPPSSPW